MNAAGCRRGTESPDRTMQPDMPGNPLPAPQSHHPIVGGKALSRSPHRYYGNVRSCGTLRIHVRTACGSPVKKTPNLSNYPSCRPVGVSEICDLPGGMDELLPSASGGSRIVRGSNASGSPHVARGLLVLQRSCSFSEGSGTVVRGCACRIEATQARSKVSSVPSKLRLNSSRSSSIHSPQIS